MEVNQDYELPCGRELETLWENLDEADDHQAECVHCRTARESLLALRSATQELIDEPDPTPPDLVGRIMSAVRAEVRRGQMLDLSAAEPGSVEVSEQAVAVVLRYAADSMRRRPRPPGPGAQGRRRLFRRGSGRGRTHPRDAPGEHERR